MCPVGGFLCAGLLVDHLLLRLHAVVVWEYETIFKTKYFIVNSKITTLCSCNRSGVVTYVYTHTHTSTCLLERENDTHIPIPTLYLACTSIHTSRGAALFIIALLGALPWHTRTSNNTGGLIDDNRHTYTHPCPRLIACTNTYTSFALTDMRGKREIGTYVLISLV